MLRYTQHDTILRATVRLRDGVIPSVERDSAQVSSASLKQSPLRDSSSASLPQKRSSLAEGESNDNHRGGKQP